MIVVALAGIAGLLAVSLRAGLMRRRRKQWLRVRSPQEAARFDLRSVVYLPRLFRRARVARRRD